MIRKASLGIVATAVVIMTGIPAKAHDIAFNAVATQGVFTETAAPLPSGSLYQFWWSIDAVLPIEIVVGMATFNTIGSAFGGDYLLDVGATPTDYGFASLTFIGQFSDSDVGGNTISDGYVFGVVYNSTPGGVGEDDYYALSPIVGNSWGNAGTTPPPTPDKVDFAPSSPNTMNAQVVPEPGTLALFGLGILTIVARRRRR